MTSKIQTENVNSYCLENVIKLWKNTKKLRCKPSTESKYNYIINKHIIPVLGNVDINELSTVKLNEYVENKLLNGRLNISGGLSPSYVRTMTIILNSTLKFAYDEGILKGNLPHIYKPPTTKKEIEIMTTDEQYKLERYIINNPSCTGLGIILSLNCGLRIGEICALKWSDISIDNQTITISHTVTRILNSSKGSHLIMGTPKTQASFRIIPIHPKILPIITYVKSLATSEFVVSDKQDFVSPRTYDYRFHRILKESDIRSLNFHSLRHTFATRCVQSGIDIKTLSEILGHSNVSTTLNTYVHPSIEMKRNQIIKLQMSLPSYCV